MRLLLDRPSRWRCSPARRTDAHRRCADESARGRDGIAAASPQAKPGAKPSAKPFAKPGASPAAAVPSPVAAASPTPPAGPVVNAPLLLSGPLTPGFTLHSSAFDDGGTLPAEYSCDGPGGGKSPPLNWTGTPSGTRAFALVDQDPDAGGGGSAFTHWVIFNLPGNVDAARSWPAGWGDVLPNGGLQGQNGRRIVGYQGACPPAGSPPHHYTFQLWALSAPRVAHRHHRRPADGLSGTVVGQTQLVALFGH